MNKDRIMLTIGYIFLFADLTDKESGICTLNKKGFKYKYKELVLEEKEQVEILSSIHKEIKDSEIKITSKYMDEAWRSIQDVTVQRNLLSMMFLREYYLMQGGLLAKGKILKLDRLVDFVKHQMYLANKEEDEKRAFRLSRDTYKVVSILKRYAYKGELTPFK